MAKDFKLDENHDLAFENNDFVMIEDGAEVAQNWKIRLYWLLGEWFANRSLGLPWFSKIFRLTASPVEKRDLIVQATLGTPGVKSIVSLEQTATDRTGLLDLVIKTDYDTTEDLTV